MSHAEITFSVDEQSHPHMKTNSTMCSAPHVNPGDMVFWHCVSCGCLRRLASLTAFLGPPALGRD